MTLALGVLACGASEGGVPAPVTPFCAGHSLAVLSSESLACDSRSSEACAFNAEAQNTSPDPLTTGEFICECRTTAAHPDPASGVYYCFTV